MQHIFFIITIKGNRQLQQIALNHSLDIDFKDFMRVYKKCTAKPYFFLVTDATLASNNPLKIWKKFSEINF